MIRAMSGTKPMMKNMTEKTKNTMRMKKIIFRRSEAVKVFFVDSSGNELELETTQILYDMLSYDDQALFDKGYKVKSQEELAVLLQDFES